MSTPDRADAEPLGSGRTESGLVIPAPASVHSGPIALIGTIAFLIAVVALLPFYGWLGEHGHRVWLWTSIAGFVEGLFGSTLAFRHRRAGRTL